MINNSLQGPHALSSESGQTVPFRPLPPTSDIPVTKRLCFYKSGDDTFAGQRLIVNPRTFKTLDALLDALSKKVPLPFGVRTITTPRGTHRINDLDDFRDGGAYVCSDQKRVKPLNLARVNRQQIPWNTTRPITEGKQGRRGTLPPPFRSRNRVATRAARTNSRSALRTPKRFVVIKNRDPSVKRTIVLHKRTAPTFDALLDFLSQMMQFPVLKLYSVDGRRMDGLTTLILCTGVIVAAGNEPFRLGNGGILRKGLMAQKTTSNRAEPPPAATRALKESKKMFARARGSKNFSLSSQQYVVNQINKSRNGSRDGHHHHQSESYDGVVDQCQMLTDAAACENTQADPDCFSTVMPHEDDIEKSFSVNPDGSMTVDMKVRLTIKEEELLHWTTTLCRSSLSKGPALASITGSGNISPDCNNALAHGLSSPVEEEAKEDNQPGLTWKSMESFSDEQASGQDASRDDQKLKPVFNRTCTPSPLRGKKKASAVSVQMVTETQVDQTTVGHCPSTGRTSDSDTTGVRSSGSKSGSKEAPKPRRAASSTVNNKASLSSFKSTKVAEVLQIQNNGMDITETVMQISESVGCYDNYFANDDLSSEDMTPQFCNPTSQAMPSLAASSPRSSIEDCKEEFSASSEPACRLKEEILSLSSETTPAANKIENNRAALPDPAVPNATNSQCRSPPQRKRVIATSRKHNDSSSTSRSGRKQQESMLGALKDTKKSLSNRHGSAIEGNNDLLGTAKNSQKSKSVVKGGLRKSGASDKESSTAHTSIFNSLKKAPTKKQSNPSKGFASTSGEKQPVKKNTTDKLKPQKSVLPAKRTTSKPKSKVEGRVLSPPHILECSECVLVPSPNPSPSDIHQYVENWLQSVSPESAGDREEEVSVEPRTKPLFQIGADTESDEKTEGLTNSDAPPTMQSDTIQKSTSFASEPLKSEEPAEAVAQNEPKRKDLRFSVQTRLEQNSVPTHPLAEVGVLTDKAKMEAVLRTICASFQNVCGVSKSVSTANLQRSDSNPDFSSQLASVFGCSSKLFLSFLSALTLRDTLIGRACLDNDGSGKTSEAMQLMESLQNISELQDKKKQRTLLLDLQSQISTQFSQQWEEFKTLRDRSENESLLLRPSEKEAWKGDSFDEHLEFDNLMEVLCVPQNLQMDIFATLQQLKLFLLCKNLEATDEIEARVDFGVTGEGSGDKFRREVTCKCEDGGIENTKQEGGATAWQEDHETDTVISKRVATMGSLCTMVGIEREYSKEAGNYLEKEAGAAEVDGMEEELADFEGEESRREESVKETDERATSATVEEADTEKQNIRFRDEDLEGEEGEQDNGVQEENHQREFSRGYKEGEGENGNRGQGNKRKEGQEAEFEHIREVAKQEMDSNERDDCRTIEGGDKRDQKLKDEANEEQGGHCESFAGNAGGRALLHGAEYLLQPAHMNYEVANDDPKGADSSNTLSEVHCEDDKGNGTDSLSSAKMDTEDDERRGTKLNPVQISQELLDFVNSALQSSSLIFTYDSHGNVRIEPDMCPRNTHAGQAAVPKSGVDGSYGSKRLPSPDMSDLSGLSDYRPDTPESGVYQSLGIVSESEEDTAGRMSPTNTHPAEAPGVYSEGTISSRGRHSKQRESSRLKHSSCDSGTKPLTEGESSASSPRADRDRAATASECASLISAKDSNDGVLIDKGRWLLRENHLIRKSPPVSSGMYGDLDDTSTDTSRDSPTQSAAHHNPLTAISSSELEEMAKPSTPKCTYFNLPHGSDSDPFPDDSASSHKSVTAGRGEVTGGGLRIAPAVDTSKNWANKNGSMSSFASVEFKLPDRRVHPENQAPAMMQARPPPSAGRRVLQAQESLETLQARCTQYCPIL